MVRNLNMQLELCVKNKDLYEKIQQECEEFKNKIMEEMEAYDFAYPERVEVNLRVVGMNER